MKINNLHSWNLSFAQARQLQKQLCPKIKLKPVKSKINLVAGLDCSISRDGKNLIAGVVITKYATEEIIETQHCKVDLNFPYIPGLLSFREGKGCLKALKMLKTQPDAIIVDGQGIAHPKKLGLASHLGLFWDIPTVGCAKSRLIGQYAELKLKKGNSSHLTYKNERIGTVLCTRDNVKPLFVSPGNSCNFQNSVMIVLDNCIKYKLPEPTRQAHLLVSRVRNSNLV